MLEIRTGESVIGEDFEKGTQAWCRCFKIVLLFVKQVVFSLFSSGKARDKLRRLKTSTRFTKPLLCTTVPPREQRIAFDSENYQAI